MCCLCCKEQGQTQTKSQSKRNNSIISQNIGNHRNQGLNQKGCLCYKEEEQDQQNNQSNANHSIISQNIGSHRNQGLNLTQITIYSIITDSSQNFDLSHTLQQGQSTPQINQPNGLNIYRQQNEGIIRNSQDSYLSIDLANTDIEKLVKGLYEENENQPNEFQSMIKQKIYPQEGFNDYIVIHFKAGAKIYQLHSYKMKQDLRFFFNESKLFDQLKKNVEQRFEIKKSQSMKTINLQDHTINYFMVS
ncbi:hypothetical protein ABPG74_011147 [Tetrahymena malaccensis]